MILLDPANRQPLYVQLADYLRRQISEGAYQPGKKLPTEHELAEELHISRGTIRQALDLLVQEGLLLRTPGKGTFIAGHQSTPRSSLVGTVVPYLQDAYSTDIVRGIESVLRAHQYSLILSHTEGSLDIEITELERHRQMDVSGLIVFPINADGESSRLTQLIPPGFPLVIIDRRLPDLQAPCVLVDNQGGAYQAVKHLLELGHRRIACITSWERPSSVEERIRGYEQAMFEAGTMPLAAISLPKRKKISNDPIPSYSDEEMLPIDQILAMQDPPTAFFCINDFLALGAMTRLLARGYRIPDEVAVVGFDDIPIAAYLPVPLTTIAQPKFEIGVRAAQLLLEQIEGREEIEREAILPTKLIVRASTVGGPSQPTTTADLSHTAGSSAVTRSD